MKTLYLDCSMGAAGDMLMGALLELHPDREAFLNRLNTALEGKAEVFAAADKKCGINGTHISVVIQGEEEEAYGHCHAHTDGTVHSHHHTHVSDIEHLISTLELPQKVKADAKSVYHRIAQAESAVHGMPVEQIHFHEVGSLDALADVLGVCMLIHDLAPEKIMASPINVGSGTVHCAHGILPVPAPATENILRGVPVYSGECRGELCTPTGAALLSHFVQSFGPMPVMTVEQAGYGTGKKDFPAANVVRALLGEVNESREQILELRCNVDDMTAEELSFAMEELFRHGALDVYFLNIQMKKSRPAVMLTCMCREEQKDEILRCIFQNTSTIGVREYTCKRYNLAHSVETLETACGPVRVKTAQGFGVCRRKPEYEDLARIARDRNLPLLALRNEFDTRHS